MDTEAKTRKAAEEEAARNDLFASGAPTPSLRKRYIGSYIQLIEMLCYSRELGIRSLRKSAASGEEQAARGLTADLMELRQTMQSQLQHGQDIVRELGKQLM